jgi:hypothetical protein
MLEEAKQEISEILKKVLARDEVYFLDGKYVRWGRVEKDMHEVLERHLTPRAVDCAYCHCTTVILSDGVHCIECGRVYKSHSH